MDSCDIVRFDPSAKRMVACPGKHTDAGSGVGVAGEPEGLSSPKISTLVGVGDGFNDSSSNASTSGDSSTLPTLLPLSGFPIVIATAEGFDSSISGVLCISGFDPPAVPVMIVSNESASGVLVSCCCGPTDVTVGIIPPKSRVPSPEVNVWDGDSDSRIKGVKEG